MISGWRLIFSQFWKHLTHENAPEPYHKHASLHKFYVIKVKLPTQVLLRSAAARISSSAVQVTFLLQLWNSDMSLGQPFDILGLKYEKAEDPFMACFIIMHVIKSATLLKCWQRSRKCKLMSCFIFLKKFHQYEDWRCSRRTSRPVMTCMFLDCEFQQKEVHTLPTTKY